MVSVFVCLCRFLSFSVAVRWCVNKWLERALISAGAAVVSTTAIVTTAERPGKRKKRKNGRKRGL